MRHQQQNNKTPLLLSRTFYFILFCHVTDLVAVRPILIINFIQVVAALRLIVIRRF